MNMRPTSLNRMLQGDLATLLACDAALHALAVRFYRPAGPGALAATERERETLQRIVRSTIGTCRILPGDLRR